MGLCITTNGICARKALNETCGQECVDWAISLLEQGHEGHFTLRLAGMLPPLNHFEIASLRDNVLLELGIVRINLLESIQLYATDILRSALQGEIELKEATARVSQLYLASDYEPTLVTFYLLDCAYSDLQCYDTQWYWDGATRENILTIIHEQSQMFVDQNINPK